MPFVLTLLTAALAQSGAAAPAPPPVAPKAAPAPADTTVSGVVVTGAAAEVQSSIDRQSYSLGKDVAATSGAIADALRNIPSVEVDLQGGLTLRGDANVTILIDGKPAPAFEGSARADALQQLPADQFERVEVITNPSAAMSPEGSGGVINLISKKSRGSGWTGTAFGTAGTAGLKRAGGTFGYNSKDLTVTGSLSSNYQHNKQYFEALRQTLNPATGRFEDHTIDLIGRNLTRGPSARVTVGYALTPKDQLSVNLSYNQLLIYGYPYNLFQDFNANGALVGFQERQGARRASSADGSLSGGWRHSFAGDGHQLSLDVIHNRTRYEDATLNTTLGSFPPVAQPLERTDIVFEPRHSEFKAAYTRPLPEGAKLTAGYELKLDDNTYEAGVARGPTTPGLIRDPRISYAFEYRQVLNAAYATYERSFGDLGVQAGLRLEDARLDLNELTTSARSKPDYFRAYPTLHLTYTTGDGAKLRASYATRVQRPPAFLLNPFRIYIDPKNYQQGNPDLQPQETQSFEAGYERRRGATLYQATAYYRENEGEFSPVTRDVGGGVVVVTFDNLGSSRSAGLELAANGKLVEGLTYTANTNIFWTEISAANLGFTERSATGVSGRINLNWQATKDDLLQLNVSAQGKRLFAQGVIDPNATLNLGWRRKLTDRVTATVSVQDLLDSNKFGRLAETAVLRERFDGRLVSRAVLLRLDYRLGGASAGRPAPEPGFDYGAPAAAP